MGVIGTIYGYALQKTGHDVEHVVRIENCNQKSISSSLTTYRFSHNELTRDIMTKQIFYILAKRFTILVQSAIDALTFNHNIDIIAHKTLKALLLTM
ncbi:hypothetical protein [Streptococcus equi]|uniref:hypothetical protein n=1 Tax=Streptococcus equi TaxID=1336 RepID=UPI0031F6A7B3